MRERILEKRQRSRKIKPERRMKVYYSYGSYSDSIPTIRLSGNWVADLGFQVGDPILVRCENGRLTITLAEKEGAL